MWEVDYSYIEEWLDAQDAKTVASIFAAFEVLEAEGPALGRPLVDTIDGTTISNLKELRPASPKGTEIRILFAFEVVRNAVMLLAGDKSKGKSRKAKWSGWYKTAIPQAEKIFEEHQEKTAKDKEQKEAK